MYLILVYDINVDRLDAVRKYLRKYLLWVQNSVFEGELTKAEYAEVKAGVKKLTKADEDSVIVYRLRSEKFLTRDIIGIEKVKQTTII